MRSLANQLQLTLAVIFFVAAVVKKPKKATRKGIVLSV
jgi:hypothetical protein